MSSPAQHESIWGLVAVVAILLFFAIAGLFHLIRPDRFMNRNTGGELLREWNRLRAQFAGAALLGFSLYPLYSILNECFSR